MRWSRRMGVRMLLLGVWAISLFTLAYPARAQAQGGGGGTHVVERGETLSQIARQYGLDVTTLMELNGLSNANLVYVGQQLVVSGGGSGEQSGWEEPSWQEASPQRGSSAEQRQGFSYEPPSSDAPRTNGPYQRAGVGWEPDAAPRSPYRDVPDRNVSDWEESDDAPEQVSAGRSWEPPAEPRNPYQDDWQDVHAARPGYMTGTSYEPEEKVVPNSASSPAAAYTGEKWIEVDIGDQTLTAWQGDDVVRDFIISSGSSKYPTVTGSFRTYSRTELQDMSGGSQAAGDYYFQPDVPWVQYFFEGYAIHGAYWHNSFGTPIGHGCINMRVEESRWLYDWTGVSGIRVEVHQ